MRDKIVAFLKKNGVLILIMLVAVVFRFWNLDTNPPGLYPDEAANGLDIIRMIDNHDFRVSYDTNGPREALFFYLQAIFVYLGHITKWAALNFTPLSLRIAPAIIGSFTVWGIYLLGKEFFNRNVGLLSAAALAVSSWHIQFSRNGFRAIMAPLALIFLFYYFLRAYKNQNKKDFILTGAWLAVGFNTYFAFRMIPLTLLVLLGYIFFSNKRFFSQNTKNIFVMFASFAVVMIPMFVHFIYVPSDILGRSSTSIFNPELNGGSAFWTLITNKFKTLTMFNFAGDPNWRHNIAGLPMLDMFTGILVWVGVAISFFNWKKIENFILISWFAVMTLPMILTAEGIPHALRVVGIIPVVFIWVGLGTNWLIEKLKVKEGEKIAVLVILLISGAFAFYRYFVVFPNAVEAENAYTKDMTTIADDINDATVERRNILVVGEFGTKTIQFLTRKTQTDLSKFRFEQYETREIKDINIKEGEYTKIFVQEDWIEEAKKEFAKRGLNYNFVAVKSEETDQILFYAYPHINIEYKYE